MGEFDTIRWIRERAARSPAITVGIGDDCAVLRASGEPSPCGPILRSGARPGDWLLVTGPLGGSIAGKHLDFTPRVAEALALQGHCTPHAMIDLSDGLAGDAGHLATESGCAATLLAD